jgi:hypothetical protein
MYVDGALGRNNPIRPLLDEAKQIWPSRPIGCVLSIGTGVALSTNVGRTLKPLMETLKSISTEAEETAREVEREMEHEHGPRQGIYFRFNVQNGLQTVGLEEWKKLDCTAVATRDYLKSERGRVQRCASQLLGTSGEVLFQHLDLAFANYKGLTNCIHSLTSFKQCAER